MPEDPRVLKMARLTEAELERRLEKAKTIGQRNLYFRALQAKRRMIAERGGKKKVVT